MQTENLDNFDPRDNDFLEANDLYEPSTYDEDMDVFSRMWDEEGYDNDVDGRTVDEGIIHKERELTDHELDLIAKQEELAELRHKQNLENYTAFGQHFDELPEDIVFKVGDQEMNRGDLSTLIRQNEELKTAYTGLSAMSRDLEANEAFMKERSYAVQLECEREMMALDRKLQDPYLTDAERGRLYHQKLQAENRKNIVDNEAGLYTQKIQELRKQEVEQRFKHMDVVMGQTHKDWGTMRENVGTYLLNSGIPAEDVSRVLSPQLAEMVLKAYKYDQAEKVAAENLQKSLSKQRAMPSNKKNPRETTPRATDARKRFERGDYTDQDLFDVFNQLDD